MLVLVHILYHTQDTMPVALVTQTVNMPGYSSTVDLDDVQSLSSDYSYPRSSLAAVANGIYSFPQTEPATDLLNGLSWGNTEGAQNFPDFPDNGSSPSGETEDYLFTSGQTTPRGSRLDQTTSMKSVWTNPRTTVQGSTIAQTMSRGDSNRSSDSSISHSSQMSRGSALMFQNVSHDAAATAVAGNITGIDSCLLVAPDANTMHSHLCWPDLSLDVNIPAANNPFAVTDSSPMHMVPAHMHLGPDSLVPDSSSPGSWECFSSSISRTSSPATIHDTWLPTAMSPNSSPEMVGDTLRSEHKPSISSESNKDNITKPGDGLVMPPGFSSRRHGSESESTARDHELYKNAIPGPDGLFHCPWEGQASCNHRPEKLKCNYDKFVDSHLKPYRCKAESCEGARFSSTACLLRHEREAHGLHGHGDKPFLCMYDGCERAVPGNGFPRQWNLRDHMKRVHNDHGSAGGSPPSATNGAQAAIKTRKRKTEVSDSNNGTTTARKAAMKASPAVDSKQRPSAKPLLEQWLEQRRALEDMVRSLNKPDDTRNLQFIGEMQKRLTFMAKMTTEMNSVAAVNVLPNTRKRSYTTG